MNLIIDVGNSFVKLAVFDNSVLLHKESIRLNLLLNNVININEKYKRIKRAIISSVGRLEDKDVIVISNMFNVLILDTTIKMPFKNLYETPTTLGVDRIALVCGAINEFPDTNALVIDAGTCITYDFVSCEREYFGGAISPGLRVRYKSLNNLTANLPLLKTDMPKSIIGSSTKDSIHSGVVYGVLNEIEGIIEEYNQKFSNLTVILTGGDSNFLSKQLKSSIFANSNFLLEGLNFILQFNSNE